MVCRPLCYVLSTPQIGVTVSLCTPRRQKFPRELSGASFTWTHVHCATKTNMSLACLLCPLMLWPVSENKSCEMLWMLAKVPPRIQSLGPSTAGPSITVQDSAERSGACCTHTASSDPLYSLHIPLSCASFLFEVRGINTEADLAPFLWGRTDRSTMLYIFITQQDCAPYTISYVK